MATVSTPLGPIYFDDQSGTDKPVALLWPSLFTDHRMWHHQIAALRAVGWGTVALDPPGHGRSPGPGKVFTMDECADAAIQVLDAAAVRSPVLILGTSWGGFVAPRVALRAPNRVRGIVLFNTSAEGPAPFNKLKDTLLTKLLAITPLDRMVDRTIVSALLGRQTRRRQPEIGDGLAKSLRQWDRRGVINSVRSVLVNRDSILGELSGVKTPTLIVSGKEDDILPSIMSRRIAEKIPNAHHVEVPDAAHLVPLEAPQVADKLILDFIRKLPR